MSSTNGSVAGQAGHLRRPISPMLDGFQNQRVGSPRLDFRWRQPGSHRCDAERRAGGGLDETIGSAAPNNYPIALPGVGRWFSPRSSTNLASGILSTRSRPSVDGHRLGLSSSAIRRSIDSIFTGSTLSAAIKVRISGSDNALLSVNSWHAVFMKCPLVVPGIYMGPKPDSGEALIFSGIECCPIGHVE
jgi:hypothetical protein